MRSLQTAPVAVTRQEIGQESAEVILGADTGDVAHRLETSRDPQKRRTSRRPHRTEGPNM